MNFMGTDTVASMICARDYYGSKKAGRQHPIHVNFDDVNKVSQIEFQTLKPAEFPFPLANDPLLGLQEKSSC